VTRLLASLRLRETASDAARKVTWLELFFDLIFVAASRPGRRTVARALFDIRRRARSVSRAVPVLAVSALAIGLGVVAALSPMTPLTIIVGLITLCAVQARTTQMHVARG
jgi:hypothetical protein